MGTVHLNIINNSGVKVGFKVFFLSGQKKAFEVDVRSNVSLKLKNAVRQAAYKKDGLIPEREKTIWRIEFLQENGYLFLAFLNNVSFDESLINTKFLLGSPDCDEDEQGWNGVVESYSIPFCREEQPQVLVDQFNVTITLEGESFKDSKMGVEKHISPVVNEEAMELAEEIIKAWS